MQHFSQIADQYNFMGIMYVLLFSSSVYFFISRIFIPWRQGTTEKALSGDNPLLKVLATEHQIPSSLSWLTSGLGRILLYSVLLVIGLPSLTAITGSPYLAKSSAYMIGAIHGCNDYFQYRCEAPRAVKPAYPAPSQQLSKPEIAEILSSLGMDYLDVDNLFNPVYFASLENELKKQKTVYEKRARTKIFTSTSSGTDAENHYLAVWKTHIDESTARYFASLAERSALSGKVRVLVSIHPDGSLEKVEILESSGNEMTDKAVDSLLHAAAPFNVFPVEMKNAFDQVEIIRTFNLEQ
jgi:TonB family protein